MRKKTIIDQIHIQTGIPKVDIMVILESYFLEVKKTVTKGEYVAVRRFGTFTVQLRKAKKARNIIANTAVQIPEHYIPKFKPASVFLEAVKAVKVKE